MTFTRPSPDQIHLRTLRATALRKAAADRDMSMREFAELVGLEYRELLPILTNRDADELILLQIEERLGVRLFEVGESTDALLVRG